MSLETGGVVEVQRFTIRARYRASAINLTMPHQRRRAAARGVQATRQDPDRSTEVETAPMLFWALLASSQIVMRKVDGWETLDEPLAARSIDLAA